MFLSWFYDSLAEAGDRQSRFTPCKHQLSACWHWRSVCVIKCQADDRMLGQASVTTMPEMPCFLANILMSPTKEFLRLVLPFLALSGSGSLLQDMSVYKQREWQIIHMPQRIHQGFRSNVKRRQWTWEINDEELHKGWQRTMHEHHGITLALINTYQTERSWWSMQSNRRKRCMMVLMATFLPVYIYADGREKCCRRQGKEFGDW